MTHRYSELMFTHNVKQIQEADGSRSSYAKFEAADFPARDKLGSRESEFIALRDTFYLATVSETGWPYVQHRGGPPGFLHQIDERTLAFLDFSGNRQFISVGNLTSDNRLAIILMDYPNRRRLKLVGYGRSVELNADSALREQLSSFSSAEESRAVLVSVEAYDWNCPKYITPRFTESELAPMVEKLRALEQENSTLRARLGSL